jgi:hypothetical protein
MLTFFTDQVGDFFFKKREILEFAMNKEESSDIKKRKISLICENTPYFKKNLCKWESSHVCINTVSEISSSPIAPDY